MQNFHVDCTAILFSSPTTSFPRLVAAIFFSFSAKMPPLPVCNDLKKLGGGKTFTDWLRRLGSDAARGAGGLSSIPPPPHPPFLLPHGAHDTHGASGGRSPRHVTTKRASVANTQRDSGDGDATIQTVGSNAVSGACVPGGWGRGSEVIRCGGIWSTAAAAVRRIAN